MGPKMPETWQQQAVNILVPGLMVRGLSLLHVIAQGWLVEPPLFVLPSPFPRFLLPVSVIDCRPNPITGQIMASHFQLPAAGGGRSNQGLNIYSRTGIREH